VVSVHGASRDWRANVATIAEHCDRENVVLVAPLMEEARLPGFQRLGRGQKRADLFLEECLREAANLCGEDCSRIFLFGHSGGAQFAHRFAMAYPHRVEACVIAASGWYTFPDTKLRFPYGIRSTQRLLGVSFNPEQYLHVPISVLVGTEDTTERRVRRSSRINTQQGTTRLERARQWTAAMRAQAAQFSMPSRVDLIELDGVGHEFQVLCRDASLVDRVFHLFHPIQTRETRHEA
jgi:poly(3-hydroxybutyrate) depolymerase